MLQESVSVRFTVLAPVFQQAVVCDMVFFFSFQLKNALQSVLERICIFIVLYWCIFYVICHQRYTSRKPSDGTKDPAISWGGHKKEKG